MDNELKAPDRFILESDTTILGFDEQGRIIQFFDKEFKFNYLTIPDLADNWKLMVVTGGYPVQYISGKEQQPVSIQASQDSIIFQYEKLVFQKSIYEIGVEFHTQLCGSESRFSLVVKNQSGRRIREVWVPILNGFGGFTVKAEKHLVHLAWSKGVARDILRKGLPGAEYMFCVEGELAEYRYKHSGMQMQWIDLFVENQGLYLSTDDKEPDLVVYRLEKKPAELGTEWRGGDELIIYPESTPRWINILVGRLTAIDNGETWQSPETIVWAHSGDWHAGAGHYRMWANSWMKFPELPPSLTQHTGWQHLIGRTHQDETYFTFDQITHRGIEGKQLSGLNAVLISGFTETGQWSGEVTLTPAPSLGGTEGFKQMCEQLHQYGLRVVLSTSRQSAIDYDFLEDQQLFNFWTIRDRLGESRTECWRRTSMEALLGFEGTSPVLARICPSYESWWVAFYNELKKLIDLGCDGIYFETLGMEGGICYAANHRHKPGIWMMPLLRERLTWLRDKILEYHPDFWMVGEEFSDWVFQYCPIAYASHKEGDGFQVYALTFPEHKRQATFGAYAWDQVSKSFMMGWGLAAEIDGAKKSIVDYPEFARYVGGLNKIRLKYPGELINGRFIETNQVNIKGQVRYSVLQSPNGMAVALWNEHDEAETVSFKFAEDSKVHSLVLCKANEPDIEIPISGTVAVSAHRAAALILHRETGT